LKYLETSLQGAFVVELEKIEDERGFFARTWCAREFAKQKLNNSVAQCNTAWNRKRGTLRGMHYQVKPFSEVKLVRCIRGAIFDCIIDLREESSSYLEIFHLELSEDNSNMLYIPEGFAHGYQTLTDGAEVYYQVSQFYSPGAESGIRWNDPLFDIPWPLPEPVLMSEKDRRWPDFIPQRMPEERT
jgi:dTDP-4-dehydrorhamnose 3,5-epimerase